MVGVRCTDVTGPFKICHWNFKHCLNAAFKGFRLICIIVGSLATLSRYNFSRTLYWAWRVFTSSFGKKNTRLALPVLALSYIKKNKKTPERWPWPLKHITNTPLVIIRNSSTLHVFPCGPIHQGLRKTTRALKADVSNCTKPYSASLLSLTGRGAGVFLTCSGRPRQASDLQPNWTLRGGNITGLRVQTVKTCGVILSAPPSGRDKLNISPWIWAWCSFGHLTGGTTVCQESLGQFHRKGCSWNRVLAWSPSTSPSTIPRHLNLRL